MTIELQRVNVKLYLEDPAGISPEEVFRVFSRWISETTDEVLIDVADYTHISQGPQTLLIGHEADYALDNTDGRLGLRYGRKRPIEGDPGQRLRQALASALHACQRLEEAPETDGRARFRASEMTISVLDRLNAPNSDQTLQGLQGDLLTVLAQVYGEAAVEISRDLDDRHCLTLHIRATGDFAVATMAQALAA